MAWVFTALFWMFGLWVIGMSFSYIKSLIQEDGD